MRDAGFRYELSNGVHPRTIESIRRAMAAGTAEDRVRLAEVDLFGRACTDAALPTIEKVCETFQPDLILREPCDYASAIAAHRRSIRTAQVAISPGRADWNGLHLASEVIEPFALGVTAAIEHAPYLSRFPVIDAGFADSRAYGFAVALQERARMDPPLVWITFGTVNTAFDALTSTWATVMAAVADLPIQVLASTGRRAVALQAPPNVEVVDWIELTEILARASAVICHGGSGTTLASLAAGIPLVVIPLLADQPTNATMVEDLGAGIAVRATATNRRGLKGLDPNDVAPVRAAIEAVLSDGTYARAAKRIARVLADRPSAAEVLRTLGISGL